MEQRHQVFISSTFTDLIEERREVIEALLEMDAIPAGMELFAAGNTDQWTLIKQVIDQSDYYIVIVGGRYGSTTAEGLSYTEMEYDYALSQGIPVMGFIHRDPETIPAGKTELDPEARSKLEGFRTKVKAKIVKEYGSAAELGGVVSRGLHKLQRDFPRPGWVRGDLAMTSETQASMAEMRAEVAELRQAAAERQAADKASPKFEGLSSGDEQFLLEMEISGKRKVDKDKSSYEQGTYVWTVAYRTTWNEILQAIGPSLMDEASEREIRKAIDSLGIDLIRQQIERFPPAIHRVTDREASSTSVEDVVVQFFALGLIERGVKKRTMSDQNRYWVLTAAGQDQVMRLRAIRSETDEEFATRRRTELAKLKVSELKDLAVNTHGLAATGKKEDILTSILQTEQDSRHSAE